LLQRAKVLRVVKSADKKDAILTKPEKIYLNNPNLYYCYCKNKTKKQIKNIDNSFTVRDDTEIGGKVIIPLWLFGFLY
jgi:hypothetical protein